MTDIVQVTTTIDDEDRATMMARTVVEEGLAACAQVQGPIRSIYRWQGSVEQATEGYCHFKTTKPRATELRNRVRQLHSYDVPEMIELPIVDGHAPYLAWVREETGSGEPGPQHG